MDMSIRFMEPEERKYAYTQSSQIIAQTGCICNLRAALGDDDEFFPVQEARSSIRCVTARSMWIGTTASFKTMMCSCMTMGAAMKCSRLRTVQRGILLPIPTT